MHDKNIRILKIALLMHSPYLELDIFRYLKSWITSRDHYANPMCLNKCFKETTNHKETRLDLNNSIQNVDDSNRRIE